MHGEGPFNFASTKRNDVNCQKLRAICRNAGFSNAASRLLAYIWKVGDFVANSSHYVMTVSEADRVMECCSGHARRLRSKLIKAGIVKQNKKHGHISLEVLWAQLWRSREEYGRTERLAIVSRSLKDSEAKPASNTAPLRQTRLPLGELEATEENALTRPADSTPTAGPRAQWGRAVLDEELTTQAGRRRLFLEAKTICPDMIDDDWIPFVATCLRAIEPASKRHGRIKSKPGFLLRMCERRGWTIRGRGGIEFEFIERAEQVCSKDKPPQAKSATRRLIEGIVETAAAARSNDPFDAMHQCSDKQTQLDRLKKFQERQRQMQSPPAAHPPPQNPEPVF